MLLVTNKLLGDDLHVTDLNLIKPILESYKSTDDTMIVGVDLDRDQLAKMNLVTPYTFIGKEDVEFKKDGIYTLQKNKKIRINFLTFEFWEKPSKHSCEVSLTRSFASLSSSVWLLKMRYKKGKWIIVSKELILVS